MMALTTTSRLKDFHEIHESMQSVKMLTGLFKLFYMKHKYKNDYERRMKDKFITLDDL